MRGEIAELKREDIKEIKIAIENLRTDFFLSRQGMTRGEKIALWGVGVTMITVIIAAISLIITAP